MKRIITSTLLLSALALFSACQKSEQQAPAKGESIVFTASFAPETKTVIKGKQSLWNQDEIRIFNGNHSEAKEYVTTAVKAATAEFKIKDETKSLTGTSFIAVCPNSLATEAWWNSSKDKTINKLWLKPEQTATASTYDPEGHVAVAYTENHELSFKNACALLKFTIKSDKIKEVCVYSSNPNDVLSGNFSFNTEGSLITTDGDKYEKKNYVKVVGDFVNGQTYYISCIPATLENGLTLEVVNTDGKKGKDRTTTNKIELKRSKIYDLGDVTYLPIFDYGIVGGFNDWNLSAPSQFVDTDGDGIYECKNVNLKANEGQNEGFKFVVNNSWTNSFGVHGDFYFDKTITGWYDRLYTNNTGDKTHDIKVSDTSKNWDIYIYAKQEADWGRELAFTILPAGSPTPTKPTPTK